jgi:hypothetical protein
MKTVASIFALMLCFFSDAPISARTLPAALQFPDHSIGTVTNECGMGDLCATLKLPGGDHIDVYNGGAPHCKPYTIMVIRMHGDVKLLDYTTKDDGVYGIVCGAFKNTLLTFDNGLAKLHLYQSGTGALFGEWEIGQPSSE